MPYDRILVPLDSTGTAQRGFQEALALAGRLGSTLVLLHVIEPIVVMPDMGTLDTWQALRDSQQQLGRQLLDEAQRVAAGKGVQAETVLDLDATRRVAEAIVAHADSARCTLIVMGTHGRRGMRRMLLGSDAELVLRLSPVPVLLARGRDDGMALTA
jgi:nucleotide-binding universal stress UspA family protein